MAVAAGTFEQKIFHVMLVSVGACDGLPRFSKTRVTEEVYRFRKGGIIAKESARI